MKTNPLRLPLYILYTLKQVKIFRSRRIKSTVCCSLESNATLLPGDYKTVNYFKKTTEWKNGAILCQKVAHSTKLLRCSRALGVWTVQYQCVERRRAPWSSGLWAEQSRQLRRASLPVHSTVRSRDITSHYLQVFWPDFVLLTTCHCAVWGVWLGGKCFYNFSSRWRWILGESWYRGLSAPLRMLSSSRTASRAQDLRSNIQSGERLWPVLNPHLANLIMSPDAQRKHSSQCAIRMYFQADHLRLSSCKS